MIADEMREKLNGWHRRAGVIDESESHRAMAAGARAARRISESA